MDKIIYVGGIPGVGKTTIGSIVPNHIDGCRYISSGEIKRKEARKIYDKNLSFLNQEESLDINRWFFKNIYSESDGSIKFVDTHYTYSLSDKSFVNLCPEDCTGGIDLFVLFEANPMLVLNRRFSRGRDRDSVDLDFIRVELEKERDEALRLSYRFSIPLEIIINEDNVSLAVNNFKNILRKNNII